MKKALLVSILALVSASISGQVLAQSGDLEAAKKFIAAGSFEAALPEALAFTSANPNNYQGHYYAALAFYGLKREKEALNSAKTAFSLAPESSKPTIQKLIDKISITDISSNSTNEADAAWNSGLYAKAAKLYEDAWYKNPVNFEGAMRAAQTFDNMGDLERAVYLVREIIKLAPDGPARKEAITFIKKNNNAVDDMVASLIANLKIDIDKKDFDAAYIKTKKIDRLDPYFGTIYLRISIEAADGNTEYVAQTFAQLLSQRPPRSEIEEFFYLLPKGAMYFSNPKIAELFQDAFGPIEYKALKEKIQDRHSGKEDCFYICPKFSKTYVGEFKMGSSMNNATMKTLTIMVYPWLNKSDKKAAFEWPQTKISFNREIIYSSSWIKWDEFEYCIYQKACTGSVNSKIYKFTYKQATEYVNWLSSALNKNFRLISAAEWEFICQKK